MGFGLRAAEKVLMRKLKLGSCVGLAVLATVALAQGVDKAIESVKPALVRIFVVESSFEQGRESLQQTAGSGVIISKDGYVVTNHHVAGWAKRIFCTLSTKERVEATLVGTDPLTDISVLKLRPREAEYPHARWGDSSKLRVGDYVYAMGSPLALSQSVTRGVVSNTELTMPDFAGPGALTLDGEDVGSMVLWIGHDAKISPGNSGGPLVNADGEVVGINEIEFGLGGAIPSNIAREVAEQLIAHGQVKRAYFGITVQPLLHSQPGDAGILVSDVLAGTPAAAAGLKSGDVILKIGGEPVYCRYPEQLPAYNRLVAGLPIGQSVSVTVLRDGKETELKLTPGTRPNAWEKPREVKQWGLCVANLTEQDKLTMKLDKAEGVLVFSVSPSGAAGTAKPALSDNDVITQLDGKPVKNVDEFVKLTEELMAKSVPANVLVAFTREGEALVTVATLGTKETEDRGLEARKPSLGLSAQVLSPEIAKALGAEGRTGFRVTRVNKGSSAEKAGIKVGDLLLSIDGIPLEASQPEDADELNELIRQYEIGSTVKVAILRGKVKQVLQVKLTEPDPSPREMERYRDANFEFTARDLTGKDRALRNMEPKAGGVWVEEVLSGGWAALGKLKTGDVILEVDGKPVANVKELKRLLAARADEKARYTVLKVLRADGASFVEIETDWQEGGK